MLTKGNVSTKEATKKETITILMKKRKKDYLIDLKGQKWSQVYDLTDPTLIENKITELLLEVLEQYSPLKYRPKKRKNTGPKLSSKCLELIKDRSKKEKNLAKTTRKDEDWNKWKIAKNLVNNRIRNEKWVAEILGSKIINDKGYTSDQSQTNGKCN